MIDKKSRLHSQPRICRPFGEWSANEKLTFPACCGPTSEWPIRPQSAVPFIPKRARQIRKAAELFKPVLRTWD